MSTDAYSPPDAAELKRLLRRLRTLDREWPSRYMLFGGTGLTLIDRDLVAAHNRHCGCGCIPGAAVVWQAENIIDDGGDPWGCHTPTTDWLPEVTRPSQEAHDDSNA